MLDQNKDGALWYVSAKWLPQLQKKEKKNIYWGENSQYCYTIEHSFMLPLKALGNLNLIDHKEVPGTQN